MLSAAIAAHAGAPLYYHHQWQGHDNADKQVGTSTFNTNSGKGMTAQTSRHLTSAALHLCAYWFMNVECCSCCSCRGTTMITTTGGKGTTM
eukprot:1140265-Pelagomonas_calceolata.AAC.1